MWWARRRDPALPELALGAPFEPEHGWTWRRANKLGSRCSLAYPPFPLLLSARSISKTHSLTPLFRGVSLTIDEGDRVGLIGPNGAGKSTLLRLLAGQDAPDEGVIVGTKGLKAPYVAQRDAFDDEGATARAIVTDAAMEATDIVHDLHEAEVLAEMVLTRVGFDEAHAETVAGSLSGGWRKRLSIARAVASAGGEPDVLLLDEPTNHLDIDAIRWLEAWVRGSGVGAAGAGRTSFASVFVTHDRLFLENVATRIVELSAAYPDGALSVDGNYSEFLRRREEALAGQARAEQALANTVRIDLKWLNRGAQARRTKSKSRIFASYDRMDELAELRARNDAAATAGARVDFHQTERRTKKLVAARGVTKTMGGRTLFRALDVTLGAGDCLGLVGPNGSGKTTLIRVLTGELRPDEGVVEYAEPKPRIAVFSQHRKEFAPETLLRDALSPVDEVRFRGQAMHITAWSRRFLFRDAQLEQPVGTLSGGEAARIHIARIMLEPADVLVLDEPTNDLDLPTLETLEAAMEDFPGALVLVTHDRAMIERLATEILSLDGRGGAGKFASLDQALAPADGAGRAPDGAAARPGASRTERAPTAPAPPAKKRLGYIEQREYDAIQGKIEEAEAALARAQARLGETGVMADRDKMDRACREMSAAQEAVAALYARWEELESKKGG